MHTLLLLSWYACTPAHWEPFFRALRKLTPEPPEILALASRTFADPLRTGAAAAPELERILATLPGEDDPSKIIRIGAASVYLDRLADNREAHWRVVHQGRGGGSPRRHIGALMHLCLDDYLTGRWDQAEELAHEGQQLCTTTGFTFFTWYFLYNRAVLAAGRGRTDEAFALADEMSHWAKPRGVTSVLLYAHHPRALAASGLRRLRRRIPPRRCAQPGRRPHLLPSAVHLGDVRPGGGGAAHRPPGGGPGAPRSAAGGRRRCSVAADGADCAWGGGAGPRRRGGGHPAGGTAHLACLRPMAVRGVPHPPGPRRESSTPQDLAPGAAAPPRRARGLRRHGGPAVAGAHATGAARQRIPSGVRTNSTPLRFR